jgi:hypothetical protein
MKKESKVEIVTFFDPQQHPHRVDYETCPHCSTSWETEAWEDNRKIICTGIVASKSDDGVIVSECPACFERSWVHYPLQATYGWSEKERNAFTKAYQDRHLSAIRGMSKSLCITCVKIEKLHVDTKHWRNCDIGSGPTEPNCKFYVSVNETKKRKGSK